MRSITILRSRSYFVINFLTSIEFSVFSTEVWLCSEECTNCLIQYSNPIKNVEKVTMEYLYAVFSIAEKIIADLINFSNICLMAST